MKPIISEPYNFDEKRIIIKCPEQRNKSEYVTYYTVQYDYPDMGVYDLEIITHFINISNSFTVPNKFTDKNCLNFKMNLSQKSDNDIKLHHLLQTIMSKIANQIINNQIFLYNINYHKTYVGQKYLDHESYTVSPHTIPTTLQDKSIYHTNNSEINLIHGKNKNNEIIKLKNLKMTDAHELLSKNIKTTLMNTKQINNDIYYVAKFNLRFVVMTGHIKMKSNELNTSNQLSNANKMKYPLYIKLKTSNVDIKLNKSNTKTQFDDTVITVPLDNNINSITI